LEYKKRTLEASLQLEAYSLQLEEVVIGFWIAAVCFCFNGAGEFLFVSCKSV
jgi:hypothetical protein